MTANKHTAGPWTVLALPYEKFVEVRANEGYSIVAHVFFNNGNRDETARLIAAAPELLELLIDSQSDIGGDWRKRRDSAIAKATGGAE